MDKNKKSNDWAIITKNISDMVASSGKSKTQIASEIGIVKSTLSQYLSGRAFPTLVTLKILCKVLDCTYEDILN